MSIVTLVSGGLDSTLMSVLAQEERIVQFPLFIEYGQINKDKELNACLNNFRIHRLPTPNIMKISGYGALLSSGLTDSNKRVFEDAFLPCRNLLFLTIGAAYAYQRNANGVAIGLLNEAFSIFPDQTAEFVSKAERLISKSLGYSVQILLPLGLFSKKDVIQAAKLKGIDGTYSCHSGTEQPCGICVACREYQDLEV